jgi:peptidoglycan-N-acetylglucosamine deacetylase
MKKVCFLFFFIFVLFQIPSIIFADLADKTDKVVALTFDDGPCRNTIAILDELKKRNIKATFFVVGFMANNHPEILRRIVDDGHEIGNHTYDHRKLSRLPAKKLQFEIEENANIVENIAGYKPVVFRPPYLDYNHRVMKIVADNGLVFVTCTKASDDWRRIGAKRIFSNSTHGLKNNEIIVFHDPIKQTAIALPSILDELSKNGYRFMTVSEIINLKGNK